MEPNDLNEFLRTGQIPAKSSESSNTSSSSEDDDEDIYYSYSDYREAKSESTSLWSDPETRVPFWFSTILITVLALMDLANEAEFDIDFIFAVAVFWVISFIVSLIIYTFIKWLRKKC